jgi:hypothetical protein
MGALLVSAFPDRGTFLKKVLPPKPTPGTILDLTKRQGDQIM